jgi:hypothetical protein
MEVDDMIKLKLFFNFGEEEQWLQEMYAGGYQLTKRNAFYHFSKCEPKRDTIRIDYRKFKNKAAYEDYIALFEDAGWKLIVGNRWSGEQYFVKAGSNESGDIIFSDRISAALRYRRKALFYFLYTFPFLIFYAIGNYTGNLDAIHIFNPKQFFYTPNLWDKIGSDFWFSFLFELFFVLVFRLGLHLLLLGMLLFAMMYTIWSYKIFRRERKAA